MPTCRYSAYARGSVGCAFGAGPPNSLSSSPRATAAAISSCTAKMSLRSRSKLCDHTCELSRARMSR